MAARRARPIHVALAVIGLLLTLLWAAPAGGAAAPVPPILGQQPLDATVVAGLSVALVTKVAAATPSTVQWYTHTPQQASGFTPIPGATSTTYVYSPSSVASSGTTFYAKFTNSFGSKNTRVATVTVTAAVVPGVPVITAVAAGDAKVTLTFREPVVGNPPASYVITLTPDGTQPAGVPRALPARGVTATSPGTVEVTGLVNRGVYKATVLAKNYFGTATSAVWSQIQVGARP